MESYKLCPRCGELVSFNTYFGGYFCKCGWKDDTFNKERIEAMRTWKLPETSD